MNVLAGSRQLIQRWKPLIFIEIANRNTSGTDGVAGRRGLQGGSHLHRQGPCQLSACARGRRLMRFFITGTAGFIGFHLARRLLDDGHSVTGYDGITPYYDVGLKRRRHEILAGESWFCGRRSDARRRIRLARGSGQGRARRHNPPRRAGGRAVQPGGAAGLCERQSRGHGEHARALQGVEATAFPVRVDEFGLRHVGQAGIRRDRHHRPAGVALRRDKEVRRGHGALLCASLRHTDDRLPVLHRLRAERPAGYVAVQIRPRHPERRADRRVRQGHARAGFHLCRRPRGGV